MDVLAVQKIKSIAHALENLLLYLCTFQKKEQKIFCIQMHFNNYARKITCAEFNTKFET